MEIPIYFNIHTEPFPGGEIRGQLIAIADDNANVIEGTAGDDLLPGLGGDDVILGRAGDDTIQGGEGNDFLSGGQGDDDINTGPGNDVVLGGAGNDPDRRHGRQGHRKGRCWRRFYRMERPDWRCRVRRSR
ncbi:CHRD domain-containing protein [Bradyrhizobium sp. TZ2]